VPPTGAAYWACQLAGWSAYAAYVLVLFLLFAAPPHEPGVIVSIVFFCMVPPILLTHGLRWWMYTRDWEGLVDWKRKMRQGLVSWLLGAISTSFVEVYVGLQQGRLWTWTEGVGWTLLGFCLAFGGWTYIYEMVHERRRRAALKLVAREAQLRALRGQLNPHFLFNSLNSLRSLISENPRAAASMVTGLSEILRYSLTADRKDTVPLSDEMAVIDEYLDLEHARFEERLHVEKVIDPEALVARVPPMLVQTLVENAVKHGIAPLPRGGLVRLEARVIGGRVEIVVTNPGRFEPAVDDAGFGLRNARERLRLLYGEQASLMIRDDGDQTKASLTLPIVPPVPYLRHVMEKTA
jgi:hypothetical protein